MDWDKIIRAAEHQIDDEAWDKNWTLKSDVIKKICEIAWQMGYNSGWDERGLADEC